MAAEIDWSKFTSIEWKLDQQMKPLIGKIVQGTITPEEKREYDNLCMQRVRRMQATMGLRR